MEWVWGLVERGKEWLVGSVRAHPVRFVVSFVFVLVCRALGLRFSFGMKRIENISLKEKKEKEEEKEVVTPKSFRVLSHNVWCHYLVPAPGRSRRLDVLLHQIDEANPKYDFVMLQELFLLRLGVVSIYDDVEYFCKRMSDIGFKYQTNPIQSLRNSEFIPTFPIQNSGLVIFSRFPIFSSSFEKFNETAEILNNKGILHTQINFSDRKPLHILTVHLDSRPQFQISQISQVQQKILSIPSTESVMIGGDFNLALHPLVSNALCGDASLVSVFDGNSPTHYRLNRGRFVLYLNQFTNGLLFPLSMEIPSKGRGIDHLLIRGGVPQPDSSRHVVMESLSREKVSDHLGLDVTFSLN